LFISIQFLLKGRIMKRAICIVAGVMLFAQASGAQAPTAGQKINLAMSMQNAYRTLKGNLTQAAEKMPEANYSFKPASDPDLRTYGQWIGHQTDNQFANCAVIKGVPNPSPAQSNEKKATKAELVKGLAAAFAFCDDAISGLTDQNALQMVKQGEGEAARGAVASALLSHGLESYGIVVVYLRAKGIAPPANPAAGRGRGGRGQ
jgi:DinB family protein